MPEVLSNAAQKDQFEPLICKISEIRVDTQKYQRPFYEECDAEQFLVENFFYVYIPLYSKILKGKNVEEFEPLKGKSTRRGRIERQDTTFKNFQETLICYLFLPLNFLICPKLGANVQTSATYSK